MSGPALASLSTVLWVIAVSALFVLLAHWSAGGSWGIVSGIVDGVRGWASPDERRIRATSSAGTLPALDVTRVVRPAVRDVLAAAISPNPDQPISEIEDLGSRSLRR